MNQENDIKKALEDLAKAIENNDTVHSVSVRITLKPKPKAKEQ